MKFYIFLYIPMAILAPYVETPAGFPDLRPEACLLPFIMLHLFAFPHNRPRGMDRPLKALSALILVAMVAILSSYLFFQPPFDVKDFMIFPMLAQYMMVYLFARCIRRPDQRRMAVGLIALCLGLSALVGISQKFNLGGVNQWLTPLYKTRELMKLQTANDYGRAVGTVGDPRHFGYFMAIGVAIAIAFLVLEGRLRMVRFLSLLLAPLCLLGLFLTASRTGILAMVLCAGTLLYQTQKRKVRIGKVIGVVAGTVLVGTWLWSGYASENAKERLTETQAASFQGSLRARIRDTLEPFRAGGYTPIILLTGRGPSKSVLPGSEHSDIGWMLMRYGAGGLTCYGILVIGGWKMARRRFLTSTHPVEALPYLVGLATMQAWMLYILAESFFKNVQIMSFNLFVLGLIFAEPLQGMLRPGRRPPPPGQEDLFAEPDYAP